MSLTTTTELDAVNVLLMSISESTVNTLEGEVDEDVISARKTLEQVSRAVQKKGWGFNTEVDFPLSRDLTTNKIPVPANCVRIDIATASVDVVQRGLFLYDRATRSYTFTQDVEASEMIILLEFDELPEAARWYVTVRAQRIFGDNSVGSERLHMFSAEEEQDAWKDLVEAEGDTEDHSIYDDPDLYRAIHNTPRVIPI